MRSMTGIIYIYKGAIWFKEYLIVDKIDAPGTNLQLAAFDGATGCPLFGILDGTNNTGSTSAGFSLNNVQTYHP